MPLSRANLGNKSEKDLAGLKRNKSAVRLDEDEETVVVDVTRLHRKEVTHHAATVLHTCHIRGHVALLAPKPVQLPWLLAMPAS